MGMVRRLLRILRCLWSGGRSTSGIFWQRSSLDLFWLSRTRERRSRSSGGGGSATGLGLNLLSSFFSFLDDGLVFWSSIIIGHFDADFPSVFALEVKLMPLITLPTTRDDQVIQVNPCLADQIGLLVVVKNRHLEPVVIGGFMDGEA